ncbi:MAG: heavy metal-binding domain-containing protein [Bacteroidota bacterium]|nr:heavy metal-binding domain-containing protein [Bacteroidota bacterium]
MKNKINNTLFSFAIIAITVVFFQVSALASTGSDSTKCKDKKECKQECKDKKVTCKKECKEKAGLKCDTKEKAECKTKKDCCKKDTKECKSDKKETSCKKDCTTDKKTCTDTKEKAGLKNTTVKKAIIDLKKLDLNKDGKIFQCTMCADQLSDVAGKCPKCKMDMKEVSLKDAKASLKKAGLKVK